MEKAVERAGNWASNISSIGKLLIAIIVFIMAVGTAWYQIETNASDNIRQDEQFKQVMETMTNEFNVWGQRSDKRYQRAMEEANELHGDDDKLEKKIEQQNKELMDLTKEVYYMKGFLDAQK